MEIEMNITRPPKPTLGPLNAGDLFLVDEKGLHDTKRVAYMKLQQASLDEAFDTYLAVVCLSDGSIHQMGEHRQVTPVEAVLTLEVTLG